MRVKGTGSINRDGYLVVNIKKKSQMQHRKVWIEHNGPIPEGYHIHHIDGNKLNNNIENLMLVDPLTHKRMHSGFKMINGIIWKPCLKCGKLKQLERDFDTNKNGYVSWCKKCNKTYKRTYSREYRKKYNQDDKKKVRYKQSEYYLKNKDYIAQLQRDKNNKKKIVKEAWKAFDYINNKEAIDEENRQHQIKRNQERMEYRKQYYIDNREKYIQESRDRYAKIKAEKEALKHV